MDISLIVNIHREGLLVHPTLQSVSLAAEEAEKNGLRTETILILDRPDEITRNLIGDYSEKYLEASIEEVDLGDLSLSRNSAINKAAGKYISFLDGDDLWGRDWVTKSFEYAEKFNHELIVWHPEINIVFGNEYHYSYHPDMDDTDFDLDLLRAQNLWTALSFGKKDIFEQFSYMPNQISKGFGFEDWNWNCTTIAGGVKHKIVPETCHFIRRKAVGSLLQKTNKNQCIMTPSTLFQYPATT